MHLVRGDTDNSRDDKPEGLWSFFRNLRLQKHELRENSRQQVEIGVRFFKDLSRHVQMHSDKRYRVDCIPQNHGSYTIVIGKTDPSSNHLIECDKPYRGRQIVVVNINYGRKGFLPISVIKGEYNISLDGPPGEPFWRCDDEGTISDTIKAICSIFDCYIKSPKTPRRA
jgi:hypothetical protein